MSKKKIKHKIRLEIGKFYRALDGSAGGHPAMIYEINIGEKSFYAIVTGSMSREEFSKYGLRKGYIKLSFPTDNVVDISLIKNRPFIGVRDDFGDKEYKDMTFNEKDLHLIAKVKTRNPKYGKYYKKLYKKIPSNGERR